MNTNDKNIDRMGNILYGTLAVSRDDAVDRRIAAIEDATKLVQQKFFTYLTSKLIGADDVLELDEFTPFWKNLSDDYQKKKTRLGLDGSAFFEYRSSGKRLPTYLEEDNPPTLKTALKRQNAFKIFGTPVVLPGDGGTFNRKRVYTNPNTGYGITAGGKPFALSKLKDIKTTISVDLYPKIKVPLKGNIDEDSLFKRDDAIAMKLQSWRGNRYRPIMAQYMNWWLNNTAAFAVSRAIRSR